MRMFSTKQPRASAEPRGAGAQASRAVLWVPLVVGGLLTAVLTSHRSAVRSLLNRLLRASPDKARPEKSNPISLALLRNAIVGKNKRAVVSVLGTPPATANGFASGSYHRSDTWYYPLDDVDKRIVVIHFTNGVAKEAEFIQLPGVG